MAEEKRKRILSGIQPTGTPTLGNYIGAVRNWALLQSDYDCLYMVADLHSLTVRQNPAELRRRTRELSALLLAVGIDPKEHVLFVQSHVPAHTQLSWVLACNTQFGELSRMTQFKDKSAKHPDNVNGGLFTYPVLMAADILIYNADLVPVGQDQTQHLEIARDIAGRFNGIYGDTFILPEGYVPASGAKIMSLAEPAKKMSKSDTNVNAFILMTDDKDAIVRKCKRAVTDSDGCVRFDRENKPGVSNLMTIYGTFTGKSMDEIADWTMAMRQNVHHQFYSTELKFHRRSGRMSGAAAAIGTVLGICPIMRLDDKGRIIAYDKVRGKKTAVARTVETMKRHAENGENYTGKAFICHSNCLADAKATKAAVEAAFPHLNGEVRICDIGTIVASHSGPGTVAVFFFGDDRAPEGSPV